MAIGAVLGQAARWAIPVTAVTALIASSPIVVSCRQETPLSPTGMPPAVPFQHDSPTSVESGLAPSPPTGQARITSSPDHHGVF
ncbi:MAG: hypothetical protein ACLQLO_12975 [Mycobacterium sp.]